MSETGDRILYYLHHAGAAYVKKLAEVLATEQEALRPEVAELERRGLIERVPGTFITWRDERGRAVTKHMNHTYFRPTRKGARRARAMEKPRGLVLSPPWKRAAG